MCVVVIRTRSMSEVVVYMHISVDRNDSVVVYICIVLNMGIVFCTISNLFICNRL